MIHSWFSSLDEEIRLVRARAYDLWRKSNHWRLYYRESWFPEQTLQHQRDSATLYRLAQLLYHDRYCSLRDTGYCALLDDEYA
jgi:hypothetical protein